MKLPAHALGRLIHIVQANRGLTAAEVSRASGGLTRADISRLTYKSMKMLPTPDTMAKLARGLGIDLRDVVRACLESVDLPVPEGPSDDPPDLAGKVRHLIATSYETSPEERGTWLMAVTMAEQQVREIRARNAH